MGDERVWIRYLQQINSGEHPEKFVFQIGPTGNRARGLLNWTHSANRLATEVDKIV